jgi:hypothetical protein
VLDCLRGLGAAVLRSAGDLDTRRRAAVHSRASRLEQETHHLRVRPASRRHEVAVAVANLLQRPVERDLERLLFEPIDALVNRLDERLRERFVLSAQPVEDLPRMPR